MFQCKESPFITHKMKSTILPYYWKITTWLRMFYFSMMFVSSGVNKVVIQDTYTPTPHTGNLKSPRFTSHTCITLLSLALCWQVLVRRAGEGRAVIHTSLWLQHDLMTEINLYMNWFKVKCKIKEINSWTKPEFWGFPVCALWHWKKMKIFMQIQENF